MEKFLAGLVVGVMILGMTGAAVANPTSANFGDFSGSAVDIDFNSIGNEVQISSQYSELGVTFSGALYGMANSLDTNLFPADGGGVIASNCIYTSDPFIQGLSFEAYFSSSVSQVGFYLQNWPSQTGKIEIFDGANSLGFINYKNSSIIAAEFIGLSNDTTFNRMVFTNTTEANGFFAIDDFRFESTNAPVPEPATMLLFGTGLAGLAAARRRKKKAC